MKFPSPEPTHNKSTSDSERKLSSKTVSNSISVKDRMSLFSGSRESLDSETKPGGSSSSIRKLSNSTEGPLASRIRKTSLPAAEVKEKVNTRTSPAKNVESSDEMKYTTGLGSTYRKTGTSHLYNTGTAPTFLLKIKTQYSREGDDVKLKCRIDGEPRPVITWEKEGRIVTENKRIKISESNGYNCLDIISATKDDSGRYTVRAVNSTGKSSCSAEVEVAHRKVKPFSTDLKPAKVSSSQTETITTSSNSFRRTTNEKSSSRTAAQSLDQQVNGFHSEARRAINDLDKLRSSRARKQTPPAAPSFTLNLNDCEVEEGESFDMECVTKGGDNTLEHSAPQFVKILEDEVTLNEGDSLTLECKNPHDDDYGMKSRAPVFTQKLHDEVLEEGDSLTIECHGSHEYTHAVAPRFVKDLSDEEVEEGENVIIQCKSPHNASTTGAPVFVHRLHDLTAEEGDSLTLECSSPSSKITGHHPKFTPPSFVNKLQDHEVEEGDSITIECKGPNDHPHSHSYKTHYDQEKATAKHERTTLNGCVEAAPPRFTQKLKDSELMEGDNLTISCKSTNSSLETKEMTTPKFVKPLNKEYTVTEGDSLTLDCTQPSVKQSERPELPIIHRELQDVGVGVGQRVELMMETRDETDDEVIQPSKPQILESLPANLTLHDEESIQLRCRISGVSEDEISWTKNGRAVRIGKRFSISTEGDLHTYTIKNGMSIDKGLYKITAHTKTGDLQSECDLGYSNKPPQNGHSNGISPRSKKSPALIIKPLKDATIKSGDSLDLKCEVEGEPTPNVVWMCNGVELKSTDAKMNLDRGVACLRINSTTPADSGRYSCRASNIKGSDKSNCYVTIETSLDNSTSVSPHPFSTNQIPYSRSVNQSYRFTTSVKY